MSENRSMTESQKPPNALTAFNSIATLPSMKSKMFARTMMTPPRMKCARASSKAAATLMSTPTNARIFGWIPSATHVLMMSRSGNQKIRPMSPVNVICVNVPDCPVLVVRGPRSARAVSARSRRSVRALPCGSVAYNERLRTAPKRAVYCMPIRDLKTQIARLPEQPGVYLYSNGQGETLYVGKARVLRDRVRSYLGAYGTSPRIDALLDEAERLEVIVTDSVVEALALENNLIKQRSPTYNILLRDDKTYPYLQLTTGEAYPRVLVARRVERDEHFYAGPFMPAALGRRTMSLTHKLFGIRSCNEVITGERGRPCLEFDIKRCIAPCVRALCSEDEYRVAVEHTKLFLEGRNDELLITLRERMADAATAERYEQAAQIRDAIRTVETLRTRQQKMASPQLGDRDAFGLKLGPAGAVVQMFQMRGGKVVERTELVTEFRDPARQIPDLHARPP